MPLIRSAQDTKSTPNSDSNIFIFLCIPQKPYKFFWGFNYFNFFISFYSFTFWACASHRFITEQRVDEIARLPFSLVYYYWLVCSLKCVKIHFSHLKFIISYQSPKCTDWFKIVSIDRKFLLFQLWLPTYLYS